MLKNQEGISPLSFMKHRKVWLNDSILKGSNRASLISSYHKNSTKPHSKSQREDQI